jgi:DNA-binding NarL/FixJ family response regulator
MIKILVADDHAVVRRGLRQILAEAPDIVLGGEATNGQEVLSKVRSDHWDVVVLDISMPGRSGLDVLRDLKHERPKLPVLVLSMHAEDEYAVRVLKAGASGYLTKGAMPEEVVRAIKKVVSGGKYVTSRVAEKLVFDLGKDTEKPPHATLSDREYEVMCMIASGKTVGNIAKELSLSVKTISTYRTRILEKMKLQTNAELTRYAISNRLVE